jgi:hypothetical protein
VSQLSILTKEECVPVFVARPTAGVDSQVSPMRDPLAKVPHNEGTTVNPQIVRLQNEKESCPVGSEIICECAREAGLDCFPNDLTRMLYLASLRDCNSGRYLHPTLSTRIGTKIADEGLRACHVQVFCRLLTVPISEYVSQLEEYIRYTRTEKTTVLHTWQSLQAYRATPPVLGSYLYRELFCLNVESALMVLKTQSEVMPSRN